MNKSKNHLLTTKTLRLKREQVDVRYAELGDHSTPHGNSRALRRRAPFWARHWCNGFRASRPKLHA